MRAVGNYRWARTISLALGAGLVAFEAVLVLSAGAVGVPGVFLIRLATGSGDAKVARGVDTPDGGESVIAKLDTAEETSNQTPAAAARGPIGPVAPAAKPRLDGLADIPLTPWDRDESKPDRSKAFAANSGAGEVLPWDAVEPMPYPTQDAHAAPADITAALPDTAPAPQAAQAALMPLPASGEVEAWIKGKATEIKGDERARPLYHFEYWLEPPADMKGRLTAVAYEFNTPAVMPQSQMSSERDTGFRILAGGLTCADKVTVTLKFKDGRSQQVTVDGCRLVDKDRAA